MCREIARTGSGMRALAGALVLSLLGGCGSNARAPVEDRNAGPGRVVSSEPSYIVQRGDTLYSIAFRYGLDYRRLGAANHIGAPYTIYPGQRLVLLQANLPPSLPPPPPAATRSAPAANAPPAVTPPSSASGTTSAVAEKPAAAGGAVVLGPVRRWLWPSDGPVIRGYSATLHKGIDIGGRRGDPVVAVADGQVVYAGAGIVGLGELLIVKHNEQYLSAYGHNAVLLVTEGQMVRAGQKIAEKGSSGTDSVRLHFEIRRDGRPVDPRGLLPAR